MAKDTIIAIGAGGQVTGDAILTVNTKAPMVGLSLTMVVVGRERRKKKWERERNTRVREREGKFGKKYSQYN